MEKFRRRTSANLKIFNELKSHTDEMIGVNLPSAHSGHICFQVTFSGTDYGLSISCPLDSDCFVETALLKSGKLTYDDIQRFSNISELIEEVNRVKAYYLSQKK